LPRVTRQRDTANGAALNITALVFCPGKQSRCPASQRSEKRSIGCSFMPNRRVADGRIYQRRSRDSAKPTILTLRWWSETAGWSAVGAWADESSHACSPTAECQTNQLALGPPSVRSAIFPSGEMERQRNVAVGKWPCSRLLLMSCTGRSLAVLLLAGRTESRGHIACLRRQAKPRAVLPCLARAEHRGLLLSGRTKSRGHFALSGAHDFFLTVSPVCGRRNAMEWKWSLRN
jgi:hypothetical protein